MTTTAPRCLLCRNSGYDDDLDVYDGRIGLCRTHAAETTARGQRWCKVCQRRYAGACCAHALAVKRAREAALRQDPAVRAAGVATTRAWRAANPDGYRAQGRRHYARTKADPVRYAARLAQKRRRGAAYRHARDRRAEYQRAKRRRDWAAEYRQRKLRALRRLMGTR